MALGSRVCLDLGVGASRGLLMPVIRLMIKILHITHNKGIYTRIPIVYECTINSRIL